MSQLLRGGGDRTLLAWSARRRLLVVLAILSLLWALVYWAEAADARGRSPLAAPPATAMATP